MNDMCLNDSKHLNDSKFVNYLKNNNNTHILHEILSEKMNNPQKIYNHIWDLYLCYTYLCKNNMISVIYDILELPSNDDEHFICLVAIDNNLINVIELLIKKSFDFYNVAVPILRRHDYTSFKYTNVLDYCIQNDNIIMFKFFIDNVIDINKIENTKTADEICQSTNEDFFNYYLDIISTTSTYNILATCCRNNSYDRVEKILKLGPVIPQNCLYLPLEIKQCDLPIIKLLLEHGLIDNTDLNDDLLAFFCLNNNNKLDIVDFLLNYGVKPSKKTLIRMFKKMNKPIIQLFMKYDVDLSMLPDGDIEPHIEFVNQLEHRGFNKDKLLYYLLRKVDSDQSIWSTPDFLVSRNK